MSRDAALDPANKPKQMKIERHYIAEMSIFKFGAIHGLTMQVYEREKPYGAFDRYYAHFKNADIKDGGCLVGTFGNGSTEREAIDNYAKEISLKLLIIDACTEKRREIRVPRLV